VAEEVERRLTTIPFANQAIARDPRYGPALALMANCHHKIDLHSWADDPATNRASALRFARQALQQAADDPFVLTRAAFVLGWFGEDIEAALRLVERALDLNPSYALGWMHRGYLNAYAGRTDIAVRQLETALRLDPCGNRGWLLAYTGIAHFFGGRFEEALEKLLLALEENPSYITTYRFLAACYAHMGRFREARDVRRAPARDEPPVMPGTVAYRNPEHRECSSRASASPQAMRRHEPNPPRVAAASS
jgi:adenylate cyclase